jgi:ABC-type multidrug transport system permease subunit
MDTIQLRIIGVGLLFVLIFLSGFRLRRSGKPYHTLLFNFHKLMGLGTLVYLFLMVRQVHRLAPLAPPAITASVITGLCFVVTIIAGGLVSIERPMPGAVKWTHKLMPYLTLLSSTATLTLLIS